MAERRNRLEEPIPLAEVIDLASVRDRLRAHARTPAELAARQEQLDRLARNAARTGDALAKLVRWDAISGAPELHQDQHAREGLTWARGFRPGDPGVILYGRAGTGKTTLCRRLLRRLQADGRTVALVSAPLLLDALCDRRTRAELIADVASVQILVLDDMGAGEWQRGWGGQLLAVADARWDGRGGQGRTTILTTNIDPRAEDRFGWRIGEERDWDRIQSRLSALVSRHIEYGGPDRRKAFVSA